MNHYISKEMKRYNHLLGEIDAVYHKAALTLGISDSILKILYTICNIGDDCLLHDICQQTGLSKQTVNSAIRKLEKDELIYLELINGKAKRVCLTEQGKLLAKNTALRIIQIENDIFASWGKADIEKYLELTEKFLIALTDQVNQL